MNNFAPHPRHLVLISMSRSGERDNELNMYRLSLTFHRVEPAYTSTLSTIFLIVSRDLVESSTEHRCVEKQIQLLYRTLF